ncbi:allergen Asp f 4 [Rhypophila decipiens]|uniref:Allergen Asp f 4 n=1 Tax=Rhypophila decipiens TaxID=261697 RepID=A0AAN7B1W6_9PEZI|nr:allergen Asp f 4 [Rhypophila decipiens]
MHLSHLLLVAGAVLAAAHPSAPAHAHLHRHAHEKRGKKFWKAEKPHNLIPLPTPAEEPAPAFSAASVPAPPEGKGKGKGKSMPKPEVPKPDYIPFCPGDSKVKRVTEAQVHYKGNTGRCGWNSNMIVIPNEIADKYDYLQTYTNVAEEEYEVRCWNKIGPDGGLTGQFSVTKDQHLVFKLAPGETKTVAFDVNTQGVCAFAPKEIPLTPFGQFAGVWAEFDWENTSNEGWSGADCSSLVAQHYNMDVPGCSMCEGGICSVIHPGGIGENAYTRGMEALDGIGLNIKPGPATMVVLVGVN